MSDRFAHLTEAQRRAIRTIDRSVLVSAAAGSGKTTVLAERCAYLVCDLPTEQRCGVGELLVVTFTDAAAGEMRTRIGAAIRQRIEERPRDAYLREQLYLLDSASISTIHAFCKTIVQKWFPQAGIDPQATILSGDEAELLRRETLETLFRELYGRDDELGLAFQSLVDQYGAGDDRQIGEIVLQIHAFINSLADPSAWLERAVRQVDVTEPGSIAASIDREQTARLSAELGKLIDYAEHAMRTIRRAWPIAVDRAETIAEALAGLQGWRERLSKSAGEWEAVAAEVRGFEFGRLKSRPRNLPDDDKAAFDAASELYNGFKKLVIGRLQERLCRFTAQEYRDGFVRTAPFIKTFTQLVRELDDRYGQAKSGQAAMDFNDLQRHALRLLAEDEEATRPSAVAQQLQRQYRYVLVDEFQDVDPLQAAIVRLVSRESADPPCGNLFTVGDIKQSIYRFRLAEPTLFTRRADAFSGAGSSLGELINLQENFRSRSGVIDAVNLVFRGLMSREFGGSEYDAQAELHAGASYPAGDGHAVFQMPAVEMHLLEPVTEQTRGDESENGGDAEQGANGGPDEDLEGIEREAVLIAQHIRTWMGLDGSSEPEVDHGQDSSWSPWRPWRTQARELSVDRAGAEKPRVAQDAAGKDSRGSEENDARGKGFPLQKTAGRDSRGSEGARDSRGSEGEDGRRESEGEEGRRGSGQRWHVTGRPQTAGGPPAVRPIEYGDIVILLRAMLHKAEPIAEILRRMGIPVRIEGGDDSLDSTEFRDIYSLLQVLDNAQQDIPLAAVLRSPMLGEPLDAGELLKFRLIDRSVPFHVAVREYAVKGDDQALRERLADVLARLDRLRTRIQREPVADVLWDVYEQTGYLAFVSGLPDGVQRRGQLIRVHELARQFGRFARQGLRRFLRFLDEMVEQGRGGPPATSSATGENAVRIMTIHASKGLEFPVVILADLQKRFNMADSRGVAMVDRELGLALQVADAERRIRYPTLLHQLAAERSRQEGLSEELRVLYVALTRAREHLMLVGRYSLDRIAGCREAASGKQQSQVSNPESQILNLKSEILDPLPRLELESAQNVLDWLLPAIGAMPPGTVDWSGGSGRKCLFSVRVYERGETDGWRIPAAERPETADTLARVGRLESLPSDEPVTRTARTDDLVASLNFLYPGLELTTVQARVSVSELKHAWQSDDDLDERQSRRRRPPVARPVFVGDGPGEIDATGRGTATHRLLQLLDLTTACDLADLRGQREALVAMGRMSRADADVVDLDAVAWFMQTDLGQRIRRRAANVRREVPFVSRVLPGRTDPSLHARDHRDVLLVRGMVDLILCGDDGLEVLDFKTDAVGPERCEERAEYYRPQLMYYAEAVSAAWRLPVKRQWLVFLHARRVMDLV
jgi:ATP-dependent helicase/nuclease subunit A